MTVCLLQKVIMTRMELHAINGSLRQKLRRRLKMMAVISRTDIIQGQFVLACLYASFHNSEHSTVVIH